MIGSAATEILTRSPRGCRRLVGGSAMVGEGVIRAKLGEAVTHRAAVDLPGTGAVGLGVDGQLVSLAEPTRGDSGPGVRMPRPEQGRQRGVFGRKGPVAADPAV